MGIKTSVAKTISNGGPFLWNNDTPGDWYGWQDTVYPPHGSTVVIYLVYPDEMTIYLPDITPESAGQQIRIRNELDPKDQPGQVILIPGTNDQIEYAYQSNETGAPLPYYSPGDGMPLGPHYALESDGVENWNFIMPLGGSFFMYTYTPA